MWKNSMGCGCGGSQVSPAYDAVDYCSSQVSPAYDMGNYYDHGNKGSVFVLIVVLFILLIIVGKCHF